MTWLIVAIIIGVLIAIGVIVNRNKLKSEYDEALKGTNKAKALKAGRAYYSALRSGTLTIYDEQAINNDIISMRTETNASIVKESSNSVLERLEKLGRLRAQGILTEAEFNRQKEKILNE